MSDSQEHHIANDEVSLIEILIQLWDKKVLILLVTFLCGCLGFWYLKASSGDYVGEFVLRGPVRSQIAEYAPLNDGIKEHYDGFLQNTKQNSVATNQFEISAESLVDDMVRELQDFEELEDAAKRHLSEIRDISEESFLEKRNSIIARFSIIPKSDRNPEVRVRFNWDNEDQVRDVLEETLRQAERNLRLDKLKFLSDLAKNIDRRKENELKDLERKLLSAMEVIDLRTNSNLIRLKEQAAIARELQLAENGLYEGNQDSNISFTILQSDEDIDALDLNQALPNDLYLRGYKSLEKEIKVIESRTIDQKYIVDPDFIEIKRKSISVENDTSAEQFKEAIRTSPFASNSIVFGIKRSAIETKNSRSAPVILALTLIFGFLSSCVFVLTSNALLRHRT